VSIYSNTESSLATSTLAIWCHVVRSRDVSPHNFDDLAMSGFAFSVAPFARFQHELKTFLSGNYATTAHRDCCYCVP